MDKPDFERIEQQLTDGGVAAVCAYLEEVFLKEKRYHDLFHVRLLECRHRLELPLAEETDLDRLPVLREVAEFLRSEEFCRALLRKFSDPANGVAAIPRDKERFFVHGARDFTPVFDLHIDLPGYEIPPHRDVEDKIVTYQFYLTSDSSLRDFGTFLCRPKAPDADGSAERSPVLRAAGAAIAFTARSLRLTDTSLSSLWRKFQRTALAMEIGLGEAPAWLPWRLFEIAKIAPALPNYFLAFAPNHRSYHAVRLNFPPNSPLSGRTVLRGFIRKGRGSENWTRFRQAAPPADP